MGAWGTSLYANDAASDLRGDYIHKLRQGKSNQKAVRELMEAYQAILGDMEEEPLFWFALADTQWNYGRLLPEVKRKALFFLEQEQELNRWRESGARQTAAWEKTRQRLREKLLSPQPPEKKVSRYRLYQCSWQLGDVYAYRLTGGYAVETGFAGQYVVFRKVSEDTWWPGHVIPVVQVYQWIGSEIPALDTLADLALLPQNGYPDVLERMPGKKKEFELKLICTSTRSLPKENLCFLGNLPGEDLHPFRGHDFWTGYCPVGWEGSPYNTKFERRVIDMYLAWKGRQAQ